MDNIFDYVIGYYLCFFFLLRSNMDKQNYNQ